MKFLLLILSSTCLAKDIDTNAVDMPRSPDWLTRPRAERVIDRMQTKLEWTIRKVRAEWYTDEAAYEKAHKLGPGTRAVTFKSQGLIVFGPSVRSEDFDSVFAHELTHVILGQKYKQAIPGYIEEGLANHLAKHGKVDYEWLARQPFPDDVRKLSHPFTGTVSGPRYHYQASQALAEMIGKKCDWENLLRLSVGKDMDSYLSTYCEIKDLNTEFKAWVLKRAKG